MNSTPFQAKWSAIAGRWGLSVEIPFRIELTGGAIDVPVLLRDFGALQGMLLFTEFDSLKVHADELVERGYGFSCLFEPKEQPSDTDEDDYLMEMFADWGWSGSGNPPAWYREPNS